MFKINNITSNKLLIIDATINALSGAFVTWYIDNKGLIKNYVIRLTF